LICFPPRFRSEDDEEGDDDGEVVAERGYVAQAEYLGRSIVTVERVTL